MECFVFPNGSSIGADSIVIGKDLIVGENVHITVRGSFKIGNYCRFGDDVKINAESVDIGDHFFHGTPGLNIGGGGSQFKDAILKVGDRCVFHNNYVNLAAPITMGNDVGLSPDVDIITHGFWGSVLEGFPRKVKSVKIDNNVIVGQRSTILMGVWIASNIVVGAGSIVASDLMTGHAIYAGNPAKLIKPIVEPSTEGKMKIFWEIAEEYKKYKPEHVKFKAGYPNMWIGDTGFNLIHKTLDGPEDDDTDKFRDFLRRFGIKIYTSRGFKSL